MSACNFAISLYFAPILMVLVPKVFVGALLMTPLNLFLAYLVWAMTRKEVFTLYFFIYGLLTMPTTVWGNTPGIFKPLLGAAIGFTLDILANRLQPRERLSEFLMAILFPAVWWSLTGGVWALAGLPIVQIFQAMLMSLPALQPVVQQGFIATFTTIAVMTMPSSIVATYGAVSLSRRLEQMVTMPSARRVGEEIHV